ncbi:hypothetical protein V1264_019072 [Littorina saxatilis]|uniref:Glutaredoxin-related protein 5, mitochondrial n=2 Tax=Littorina saxatilis TaxID=31220 RepID=A0AAN9BGJ1_9CAEN
MNFVGRQAFRGPGLTFCRLLVARYSSKTGSKEYIDGLVKGKPVVVFMKGTPDQPRCGFSNAVVQILRFHGVENFDSVNVLEDEDVRQGIKEYTEWPTIPQIFMNGEFLGGCDIMMDMHKNGELIEELKKAGIRSALLEKAENKD